MKLPYLQYAEQPTKLQVVEFKGYNANSVIADGEMSDCKNVTADDYPVLMPRKPRSAAVQNLTAPTGLFVKEGKICYVDGTHFYYDGASKGIVVAGEKQFVAMGDRIILWPDKTYYDISDDKYDTLQKEYKATGLVFTTTTITTLATASMFPFKSGDAVKLSGCATVINNKTAIIKSFADRVLTFADNTFTASTETVEVTIVREVPDMEFVCEYGNRLWGCKDNTIYASYLGDPTNFNTFKGLASDAYSVSVGTDGKFTGCIGFKDHITFFKEQCIHRIYGSKPSNFQFSDTRSQGIQRGCAKSVVNISDTLIYQSLSGISAYSGGTPELISQSLGAKRFLEAVAGTDGKKYYVSLKGADGGWSLFVFDLSRKLWLKEDDTHAIDFSYSGGKLYMLSADKKVYVLNADDGADAVEWSATFGEMTEGVDAKKIHTRFVLQTELLDPRSAIRVLINQDRKGWVEIYHSSFQTRKTVSIPIVPTRCEFLNIRIEGKGPAKLYSLSKVVQLGSEAK